LFNWPFAWKTRGCTSGNPHTPAVDVTGLPELLAALPNIKVQLLNAFNAIGAAAGTGWPAAH
jgi:hypothetical protein